MASTTQPERLELLTFFQRVPNTQFVIPVYQRNYIWTVKKQINKFLEDYKSVLNGERTRHFIGIIMYLKIERGIGFNEFSVVDGQQRLVSTFLILYALKKLAEEDGNKQLAEQINNQYLINQYATSDNDRLKLKPLVSDDNVFSKIIRDEVANLSKEEKKTNVYLNYKAIIDFLKQLKGRYMLEQMLYALNKFYFVAIPLDGSTDDAQKIFETINSAGAALSKSDLIRNYILMNIENSKQEMLYERYWYPLEKKFEESGKIENFFRMFLANRNYNLCNMEDVYVEFQKWYDKYIAEIQSVNPIEDALRLICNYADYYYDIFINDTVDIDPTINAALKEFKKCAIEPTAPLLMEVYSLYRQENAGHRLVSSDNFAKIINLFNTYTIRRNICNQRTGILTRVIPLMLKSVIESCDGNYTNIYTHCVRYLVDNNKDKQSFMPDDEYLKSNLKGLNAYALKNYVFVIFEKIESYKNPAPVDFSVLNIEHLMPQTPTKEWIEALGIKKEVYEYNLNRLGNLTLATASDNSKMSNNLFEYKKAVLESTSHLKMNAEILACPTWGIDEIDKRTDNIINRICELYPYVSAGDEVKNFYNIHLISENCKIDAHIFEDLTIEIQNGSNFKLQYNSNISQMENEGIVIDKDGKFEFVQSYPFETLEKATEFFIPDNNIDVWELWLDRNDEPLNVDIRVKLTT